MKVAYLILTHNTPNHLKRLVRALDSANASFFIHVDRKSDVAPFRDGLSQGNVTFLKDRIPVYWADFSNVSASITLIREALSQPVKPDYLVLLSGSDYPLGSPTYIEDFLSRNSGREFINLVRMPCEALGKPLNRLEFYWLKTPLSNRFVTRAVARLNYLLNHELRLIKRDYNQVFDGLIPYAGSQWWALTKQACQHILNFIESRPKVVNFFKNVYIPDESFFQTLIGNSPFARHVTRNLTFTDWSRPSGGPAIIDMDHLNEFLKTTRVMADDIYGQGELLFARKFPDDSLQLTDFIDANLINRTDPHSLFDQA